MTQHELTPNRLGNELGAIAASGTVATHASHRAGSRLGHSVGVNYRGGPSPEFVALTRNPELAANPPSRFEPTVKGIDDVVI
jgi:hypothetical protein